MKHLRLLYAAAACLLLVVGARAQSPAITTLHTFDLTHGAQPDGEMVAAPTQDNSVVLYGTTVYGGTTPYGTIYSYVAADTMHPFQTLWAFDGKNGANPNPLMLGPGPAYFGTTQAGGQKSGSGYGTLFSIAPHGTLHTLYTFIGGADGAYPFAPLTPGRTAGTLYGTTSQGGANGAGTIFKIGFDGVLHSVYSFRGGEDGFFPVGGIYADTDGSLYGATAYGGKYGDGTLYRLRPNGTYSVLHSFHDADGTFPNSTLTMGPDGLLYGTTPYGGFVPEDDPENRGFGTVYRVSPATARFEVVHTFSDNLHGGSPSQARLALGSDGAFYGTTYAGGFDPDQGGGTVFRLTTGGLLTTLYKFDAGVHGGFVNRGVTLGPDGFLYGATRYGGLRNGQRAFGTLFRLPASGD